MSTYRVAVEPSDPLHVDVDLAATQWSRQRIVGHVIVTLASAGLWSPVLIHWLATGRSRARQWAADYSVRIDSGVLVVGGSQEARRVPLDAIADVAHSGGYVNVSVRGSHVLQILGLRDPDGASRAILDARDTHVRALRGEALESVLNAPPGSSKRSSR